MTLLRNISHTITSKHIAIALIAMMLVLAFAYVYFLFMSVVHVVIRTEVQHDIKEVAAEISRYEQSYIATQHLVSRQLAEQSGYVAITEKDFIDRTQPHLVLSVLSSD